VAEFLHERRDFDELLAVVAEYIDIHIDPPIDMDVKTGANQDKPAHIASRKAYYDELAKRISIPGIVSIERDTFFDDKKMRSAGIRLLYSPRANTVSGIKDGILLELGFDDTVPNRPITISSWALDFATDRGAVVFDNRAVDVPCHALTHTFVEKLQTISTKYRLLAEARAFPANFLRHYYDVYCLLELQEVQEFMRTPAYQVGKVKRFRSGDEPVIAKNPAFTLNDSGPARAF
jgi:hypothetical protein